jgi:integrase
MTKGRRAARLGTPSLSCHDLRSRRASRGLGIEGISLHSYRYAWAERAKAAGYPERFAQEALGHNSKAVHRAYAKKAQVKLPALEEYEQTRSQGITSR